MDEGGASQAEGGTAHTQEQVQPVWPVREPRSEACCPRKGVLGPGWPPPCAGGPGPRLPRAVTRGHSRRREGSTLRTPVLPAPPLRSKACGSRPACPTSPFPGSPTSTSCLISGGEKLARRVPTGRLWEPPFLLPVNPWEGRRQASPESQGPPGPEQSSGKPCDPLPAGHLPVPAGSSPTPLSSSDHRSTRAKQQQNLAVLKKKRQTHRRGRR